MKRTFLIYCLLKYQRRKNVVICKDFFRFWIVWFVKFYCICLCIDIHYTFTTPFFFFFVHGSAWKKGQKGGKLGLFYIEPSLLQFLPFFVSIISYWGFINEMYNIIYRNLLLLNFRLISLNPYKCFINFAKFNKNYFTHLFMTTSSVNRVSILDFQCFHT